VPGILPIALVVARSQELAVTVSRIAAYPQGFEFELVTTSRTPGDDPVPMPYSVHGVSGPLAGLAYANGARATLGPAPRSGTPRENGLNLLQQSGTGSETSFRQILWASPLPPAGPVTFAAAWQDRGLQETTATLDGALFKEAAERAIQLWPDEPDVVPQVDFSNAPTLPPGGSPPADAEASERAIRAAFSTALESGPAGAADPMSAVQDGRALAGALEELRARFPMEAATTRLVVGRIVFLDDVRAALNFQLVWAGAGGFGAQLGYAVRERGEWKVARDTYCRILGWAGVPCPPPPPVI
jgi:hypothetical protein